MAPPSESASINPSLTAAEETEVIESLEKLMVLFRRIQDPPLAKMEIFSLIVEHARKDKLFLFC